MPSRTSAALAFIFAIACSNPPPPAPVDAGPPPPPPEVTLILTGDESGWLLATGDTGKEKGGAAEALGRWTATEKHCDGPLGPDGAPACPEDGTLVLSTGDHFTGAAISAFFLGDSTAQAMKAMGYAASAFGKHELDYGRDTFAKNKDTGGFPYLAANLTAGGPAKGLELPAFKTFKRRGIQVAVIGLANVTAPQTTMPGRMDGITVGPYEAALAKTVPEAWQSGADAVVVLADACPADFQSVVSKHPDWKLALVAAGHCGSTADAKAGTVPLVYTGKNLEQYVSAKLSFDPKKPAGQRMTGVDVKHVQIAAGQGVPYPNTGLAIALDSWKKKLDAQLGKKIGFTKSGLEQSSPMMAKWITTAWKDTLKADVAVGNKGGIRSYLSPGDITEESVYTAIPFENSLMLAKVKGASLIKELQNPQAIFAGVQKDGKKFKDAKKKPLDPKKVYTVVVPDFIYFGGDGFGFEKADPRAVETGMTWQTPVVDWTQRQKLSPKEPLEKKLK